MNEQLIDYALGTVPTDQHAAVEVLLAADPTAVRKLHLLKSHLAYLATDRAEEAPPVGLALSSIAHVAEYLANNPHGEPVPPTTPKTWANDRPNFIGRPRADILVAASIAFVFLGLLLPGIQKLRQRSQTVACQDNLRELHSALVGYSDTHDGRFPQVGSDRVPTAGAFVAELTRAGQYPMTLKPLCPSDASNSNVGYAYSLGYHSKTGDLVGPRLPDPEASSELLPISADLPTNVDHGGWNVLMAGGSVRFTKSTTLGTAGDDIFTNDDHQTRAGLHRHDVSLGRPFDRP